MIRAEAHLRRRILSLLPPSARQAARTTVDAYLTRRKRFQQVAWVLDEFSAPRPGRLARTLIRMWLLPRRRVLFYPNHPSRGSVYFKSCILLGYGTTDRAGSRHDVAIRYGTADFESALPGTRVLNLGCTDVSKTRVGEVFERVFGYPLAVDPTSYTCPMVEKSDANATHDGRIVQGPVPAAAGRPGCVYQKAVDNADGQGHTIDFRVPLLAGEIPVVYKKWRPGSDRFGRDSVRVELCEPSEVLSAEERARIAEMGREMGVDLAEMDVLRDNGDGRIYVVDVNHTPDGPARGMSREGRIAAMARMSRAFEAALDAAIRT